MARPLANRVLARTTDAVKPFLTPEIRDVAIGGIATLLREKVVTYGDLAGRDDVRCWWFGTEGDVEFTEPRYYTMLPPEIDRLLGHHTVPRSFVLEVPRVTLKSTIGFKQSADGKYIVFDFHGDTSYHKRSNPERSLASDVFYGLDRGTVPDIRVSQDSDVPVYELVVPLLSRDATNYTHWHQECLATLRGVEEYESRTNRRPLLVIPPDPPDFVHDSLAVLGYSTDEWLELRTPRIKAKRMVLPSIPRFRSDTSDDYIRMGSALRWVADRARTHFESGEDDDRRIIISREDATTRRMANREAVDEALSERGFERYVTGRMSYREQVRLFDGAEFIVGAHGAGMINAIYASGAPVLELFGSHFLPANYELAQQIGSPYGCLECRPVGDDFEVPIENLNQAIDELIDVN